MVIKTDNDFFKRRGKVKVSMDAVKESPKAVMEVLSKILIVKAENDFMTNSITYRGYSNCFEPLEDACMEGEYEAVVNTLYDREGNQNGYHVNFVKR